jgi:integrase/recombinase XerD
MTLSIYTRHSKNCAHQENRLWKDCNCPKWIQRSANGTFNRWSAKTRSWEQAEERCSLLKNGSAVESRQQSAPAITTSQRAVSRQTRVSVARAVDEFLVDAKSRNLEDSTLSKLDNIFRKQLLTWCKREEHKYLNQLDHNALLHFRSTWKDGDLSKQKKQNRLSTFFRACIRRGYLKHNPVQNMGKIKVVRKPTNPFTREEFDRIIAETYHAGNLRIHRTYSETDRIRLRIMVLLLRWSGLRIRDAVTLERNRLHNDSLLLYQAKTGIPVYVPLLPQVAEALRYIPPGRNPNPRYFFWSGNGHPKSAVANWQRSMRRLFTLADIKRPDGAKKRCHPHMFRDTFAVELLLAGVPMDQVSLLLGHTSIKTTERHYAPFVKARQLQLQESVRNAWKVNQSSRQSQDADRSGASCSVQQTRYRGWQLICTEPA